VLDKLRQEYMEAIEQAEGDLVDNPFATIRDGRLHLKRPDALEVPERVKQVKRVIETSLPHVRIEDLLQEIDRLCRFTRELRPLSGYEPRVGNLYQILLGALIAHGTNLGLVGMAHSVDGMTVDMLQYVSQMFLTETTLKAANTILVDYHHRLALSSIYGAGMPLLQTANGLEFRPVHCWPPFIRDILATVSGRSRFLRTPPTSTVFSALG
jgi:hypothetical protein